MPDPEWHAGKSATHLLNMKLHFMFCKQVAMKASIEYMSGGAGDWTN